MVHLPSVRTSLRQSAELRVLYLWINKEVACLRVYLRGCTIYASPWAFIGMGSCMDIARYGHVTTGLNKQLETEC